MLAELQANTGMPLNLSVSPAYARPRWDSAAIVEAAVTPSATPGQAPLDYRSLADAALMALVDARDQQALAVIYDRYARPIYSLAIKMMRTPERAEEVVQEVFIKLWRRPDLYNPQRGPFIKWILSVTHNQAIDQLTQERHHERSIRQLPPADQGAAVVDITNLPDASADPAEEAWCRVRREIVRGVLARLPAAQQQAIKLAYFGGLTQPEIAELLGTPLGTVKTRTRLAFQKLRALFAEAGLDCLC